jgi:REP element-mobilizing transposase RayT
MTYDPLIHRRRSIRAGIYDYTEPGAYFITLCTYQRQMLFGQIENSTMVLNAFGRIVYEEWLKTAQIRPNVALDAFIVMPNHVHGILYILERLEVGSWATGPVAPTGVRERHLWNDSLGSIVGQFKSAAAKRINPLRGVSGVPVWQRNYYEHIIRSDRSLDRIREYIAGNPARWAEDRYYINDEVMV